MHDQRLRTVSVKTEEKKSNCKFTKSNGIPDKTFSLYESVSKNKFTLITPHPRVSDIQDTRNIRKSPTKKKIE